MMIPTKYRNKKRKRKMSTSALHWVILHSSSITILLNEDRGVRNLPVWHLVIYICFIIRVHLVLSYVSHFQNVSLDSTMTTSSKGARPPYFGKYPHLGTLPYTKPQEKKNIKKKKLAHELRVSFVPNPSSCAHLFQHPG